MDDDEEIERLLEEFGFPLWRPSNDDDAPPRWDELEEWE